MSGLDAYSRHKKFINDYVISLGEKRVEKYIQDRQPEMGKTDYDILQENHKFIREPAEDDLSSWEVRMAVKYYNKLFKEYCIADMSRYKTGQIGLRWRTQKEVFSGDGQFRCGNQACLAASDLSSYEMNFVYKEHGEKKEALVKLRLCPECGVRLNYKKLKEREKKLRHDSKVAKKKARREKKAHKKQRLASRRSSSKDTDKQASPESDADSAHSDSEPVSDDHSAPEAPALDSQDSSQSEQNAPGEWQQVVSKTSGKIYWYNVRSGATQWQPPATATAASAADGRAARQSTSAPGQDGDATRDVARKRGRGADGEAGWGKADEVESDMHDEKSQALLDKEAQDARAMWRTAPKELVKDGSDEFDEYFTGMFP
eukprot:Tamp_06586.p1 GENE.Tamp_06586~~Tamp_06586.p1  ORF type:complete len:431 (-),score=93.83 Tamp_06586:1385-2503(-)